MAGVELKSVAYLLDKIFFIRIYQRGYKWNKEQLNDLLDDFKEFIDAKDKNQNEFYCLQPIVIKKLTKEEKDKSKHTFCDSLVEKEIVEKDIYEVIDGQQRLTTIDLILSYLEKKIGNININSFPKIIYEIRPDSNKYLQKFKDEISLDILKSESDSSIDFYHMFDIFISITKWFDKYPDYKIKILELLTSFRENNVRVIWYEVDKHENSIEVFRRFNAGKIPLNNAELIKAVFLKDNKGGQLAQKYIISQQWEVFENKLQDSLFWSFLNPEQEFSSRIEYLFNLVYEGEIRNYDEKSPFGTDKNKVFRYFDKAVKESKHNLLVIWDKVSNIYDELNQFYNHPVHYHYIGLLNNLEDRQKFDIVDFIRILNTENDSVNDKGSLTKHLLELVKKQVKKYFDNNQVSLDYNSKAKDLRNFFLLLNVEITKEMNKSIGQEFAHRYPFSAHQATEFDIEHIGSQTDREPKKDEEKIQYLSDFYLDYYSDIDTEFKLIFKELWKNPKVESTLLWKIDNVHLDKLNSKFEYINEQIKGLIESQDQVLDKDSIGNLTLLNSDINRSYGNAFFPTKRRLIIEKDLSGSFIPLGTKNVFLKYYSKNSRKHTRWVQKDIESYKEFLSKILIKYQ